MWIKTGTTISTTEVFISNVATEIDNSVPKKNKSQSHRFVPLQQLLVLVLEVCDGGWLEKM